MKVRNFKSHKQLSRKKFIHVPTALIPAISEARLKNFAVFEQFTWNEALDPNLFKLEVPKDFTIEKK
jgi:hypothetical protein